MTEDTTKVWLINARLDEDRVDCAFREKEDIERIMESCCHFITEQFPNMDLTYRILGAQTHE